VDGPLMLSQDTGLRDDSTPRRPPASAAWSSSALLPATRWGTTCSGSAAFPFPSRLPRPVEIAGLQGIQFPSASPII